VRLPDARGGAVLAIGLLATGILIGVAIGPVAVGSSAASAARQLIAVVTGGSSAPSAASSSGPPDTADNGSSSGGSSTGGAQLPDTAAAGSATPPAVRSGTAASPDANAAIGDAGTTIGSSGDSSTTPPPSTTTEPQRLNMKAVVLALDPAAKSFYVADKRARLYEVHSQRTPKLGTAVRMATKKLANGTLSATRVITSKHVPPKKETVQGTVSFVDATNGRYTLSARGVSLFIAASGAPTSTASPSPGPAGTPTTTTPTPATGPLPPFTLPNLADRVRVQLRLPAPAAVGDAATLVELTRTALGTAPGPLELAGLISTVDTAKRTVTISADGPGLSSDTITIAVPDSIDLTKITPAEAVVARVSVGTGGTYTLTGIEPDTDATAADDATTALGDFVGGRSPAARAARRLWRLLAGH
jgi:hypothetical protein